MTTSKEKQDLIASRNILEANIGLFHRGHADVYRVVATELRKLLCDRPRSLVERLFPSARLHPTASYRPGEDLTGLVVQVPAEIHFTDGKARIVRVFHEGRSPLPLETWLDQPFLNAETTLRVFIRSVADKEGAHADPEFNAAILASKQVRLGVEELLGVLIVAVGEYVLKVLDMAISHNAEALGVAATP